MLLLDSSEYMWMVVTMDKNIIYYYYDSLLMKYFQFKLYGTVVDLQ